MGAHIDVVGYLLVAVVFSVGFLIARNQDAGEATVKNASDASWRLREALTRGERVTGHDLTSILAGTRPAEDRVAVIARAVNALLWLLVMVGTVDAWRMLAAHRPELEAPEHASLLVVLLALSATAVFVLGEYHLRSVKRTISQSVAATTIGRLQATTVALERGTLEVAAAELSALSSAYPQWCLLTELAAYIDYRAGDAAAALAALRRLSEAHPDRLHLAPLMITAASLDLNRTHEGLEALDALAATGAAYPDLTRLRSAAGLLAGEVDSLLNEAADTPVAASVDGPLVVTAAAVEQAMVVAERSTLDLRPDDLGPTARALQLRQRWDSAPTVEWAALPADAPVHLLTRALDAWTTDRQPFDDLVAAARASGSVYLLESAGLLALAFEQARAAMDLLEAAGAIRPASSRIHWLTAVAYHRLGWDDAARSSLDNSRQLAGPSGGIVDLTEAAFWDTTSYTTVSMPEFVDESARVDELRVLCALVNARLVVTPPARPSARHAFADALVAVAHGDAETRERGAA